MIDLGFSQRKVSKQENSPCMDCIVVEIQRKPINTVCPNTPWKPFILATHFFGLKKGEDFRWIRRMYQFILIKKM